MTRQHLFLALGLFYPGGEHVTSWRSPAAEPDRYLDIDYYAHTAEGLGSLPQSDEPGPAPGHGRRWSNCFFVAHDHAEGRRLVVQCHCDGAAGGVPTGVGK